MLGQQEKRKEKKLQVSFVQPVRFVWIFFSSSFFFFQLEKKTILK